MKPTADMLTSILHNFRVNGRFNQDQLIIGRGVDEILQLMISDTVGIRYTPGDTGERTFTIQGTTTDHHPVFDDEVVLHPYPKPSNDFTNYYVLAEEDTIWISEEFPDPEYPGQHYVMFIGSEQSGAPHQWMIINIAQGNEDYDLNWSSVSSTYYFLGSQEGVTWSNGEASVYPESPNDFGTRGFLGVQPVLFEMSNQVGSDPKLEYTNDGNTWYPFSASGSVNIEYEPIEFDQSYLSSDGKITIQHDFNDKNVLCLGYTPQPKEIEYLDNQLVLDYSDQNGSNFTGAVWFVNSAQSMLVSPGPDHSKITVSGAGESDINGVYTFVPEEEYSNHLDANNTNGFTNTTMWANDNGVIFDGINGGNRMVFIYRKNPSGSDVVQYVASSVDQSLEIVDVPLNRAAGSTPVPTLTWGGN